MGEQGEFYILNQNRNLILASDIGLVGDNSLRTLKDMAQFESNAINYNGKFVAYYNYKWGKTMASFSKIKAHIPDRMLNTTNCKNDNSTGFTFLE